MARISSRMTVYYKLIFPIIWFGFLAAFAVGAFASGIFTKEPFISLFLLAMAAGGYLVMRKLVLDLVDEVHDFGDRLVVKNRRREDSIAVSNVMNVSVSYMNPTRVTLRLTAPSLFGDEITFCPASKFTLNPFARNPVAENLIVRVDKARASRAV